MGSRYFVEEECGNLFVCFWDWLCGVSVEVGGLYVNFIYVYLFMYKLGCGDIFYGVSLGWENFEESLVVVG